VRYWPCNIVQKSKRSILYNLEATRKQKDLNEHGESLNRYRLNPFIVTAFPHLAPDRGTYRQQRDTWTQVLAVAESADGRRGETSGSGFA
jgi:hypothetical protein